MFELHFAGCICKGDIIFSNPLSLKSQRNLNPYLKRHQKCKGLKLAYYFSKKSEKMFELQTQNIHLHFQCESENFLSYYKILSEPVKLCCSFDPSGVVHQIKPPSDVWQLWNMHSQLSYFQMHSCYFLMKKVLQLHGISCFEGNCYEINGRDSQQKLRGPL